MSLEVNHLVRSDIMIIAKQDARYRRHAPREMSLRAVTRLVWEPVPRVHGSHRALRWFPVPLHYLDAFLAGTHELHP